MNVLLLGTRGIPARHGGFETFAQQLSLFLVERGHTVTVYCQLETDGEPFVDLWNGITRVWFYGGAGPGGTVVFDYKTVRDALKRPGIVLTLGYNTAVFSLFYKVARRPCLMNMDGLEWKREKWSYLQRAWLRLNEFAGARLSTHLIADHPKIAEHLEALVPRSKITMIPYGANPLDESGLSGFAEEFLGGLGLEKRGYALVIARAEPENSLLEIVQAFSAKPRPVKLVVLGTYRPEDNAYQRQVMESASQDVVFLGPIYDAEQILVLRCNARMYLHGHRVGGTNPSLVEALSAHNAIVAQDNPFNRWVAGPGARYFQDVSGLSLLLDTLLEDGEALHCMQQASKVRHTEAFLQQPVLESYEALLARFAPAQAIRS